MKTHFLFLFVLLGALLTAHNATAQNTPVRKKAVAVVEKTETFQVLGNCGMCKKTIETAAKNAGVSSASWDNEQKMLTITFDPGKISVESVQKAIAQSGYDNVGYKAPDDAYNKLHDCCHYDRSGRPSSAKACEMPTSGNK